MGISTAIAIATVMITNLFGVYVTPRPIFEIVQEYNSVFASLEEALVNDLSMIKTVNVSNVVEETIVEEEPYFVDIVDGYITEESLASLCKYVGKIYDLPPELLHGLAFAESTYYTRAVSHCNARGLCQIMPKWHSDRMEKLNVDDLFDPLGSLMLCADYLTELKNTTKYGDDIRFVLMAYNQGTHSATKTYKKGVISKYANKIIDKSKEVKEIYYER